MVNTRAFYREIGAQIALEACIVDTNAKNAKIDGKLGNTYSCLTFEACLVIEKTCFTIYTLPSSGIAIPDSHEKGTKLPSAPPTRAHPLTRQGLRDVNSR